MGLFSSSTETRVGTTVSRAVPDGRLPHAAKTGTLKAIIGGDDLVASITGELTDSLGQHVEQMYAWAQSSYLYGLPSGQFLSSTQGHAATAAVLAVREGVAATDILIEYCHISLPNLLHRGWMALVADHGWAPASNQLGGLSAIKGVPVYLADMVVVVPTALRAGLNPVVWEQWGLSARAGHTPAAPLNGVDLANLVGKSPVEFSDLASVAQLRVSYVWQAVETVDGTPQQVLHSGQFTIVPAALDLLADYVQVKYTVGTTPKWWLYQTGTGTYPTLDALAAVPPQESGTFFPFAYFRYGRHSELADPSSASYLGNKKLTKLLGLNYDSIATAIDTNPDIGNVEQAMLLLAVPADTSDPLEQRYLYQFFDRMYAAADEQYASPTAWAIPAALNMNMYLQRHALVIQDARFKLALVHAGIFKKRVVGQLGPVGSYHSATGNVQLPQSVLLETDGGTLATTYNITVPYHYYRYQVSAVLYDEIAVADLALAYDVYEGYYTLSDTNDQAILLVPLDHSLTVAYPLPERETLYARSLHYVFNSRVVTEVAWYQQAWFQDFLMVVAIMLTILSMGSDGGFFVQLAAAATAQAAALIILQQIVVGLLVSYAFKQVAQAVGAKLALVIAIVAAVYGGAQAIEAGSLKGAPWATELLQVSTGLAKGVSATLADAFATLATETSTFQAQAQEQSALLEQAQSLLDSKSNLLSPLVIFGETPDDFYTRTVHSGNIGMVGIDAIGAYVDTALALPKLTDTIGNSFYD